MVRGVMHTLVAAALASMSCQVSPRDGVRPTNDNDQAHQIPAAAKAVLEQADDFELLSLKPDMTKMLGNFHGWLVLGKTVIKDATTRKKLVEAFEQGIREYKDGPANCFKPRHGIRVKHDGKTAEFVICFECAQVHVSMVDGSRPQGFLISSSPAALFNEVLKEAGVPLAEQVGEEPSR
jgi:hypothetical protein